MCTSILCLNILLLHARVCASKAQALQSGELSVSSALESIMVICIFLNHEINPVGQERCACPAVFDMLTSQAPNTSNGSQACSTSLSKSQAPGEAECLGGTLVLMFPFVPVQA